MASSLRFLLFSASLFPLLATAGDNLSWRCWYDQQVHVTCLIDSAPDTGAGPTAPALPADLPAIVRGLRQDPGAFKNRIVHIPLHAQPYDMAFTGQLAQAVMCGSRPGCTVNFTPFLPPAEEVVALLNKHWREPSGQETASLAAADED